jgi:hypothetical protein
MIHPEVNIVKLDGGGSGANGGGQAQSGGGISIALVEGTGSAPGFLKAGESTSLQFLEWSFHLKAVNTRTTEGVTIDGIQAKVKGANGYLASSWSSGVQVNPLQSGYEVSLESESPKLEPFPILVPPLGTVYLRVHMILRLTKRTLWVMKRPAGFRADEVKAPDIYALIWRKITTTVSTSRGHIRIL